MQKFMLDWNYKILTLLTDIGQGHQRISMKVLKLFSVLSSIQCLKVQYDGNTFRISNMYANQRK